MMAWMPQLPSTMGYAKVDNDRDERNRLVLGQFFGFHEERAHLAESIF